MPISDLLFPEWNPVSIIDSTLFDLHVVAEVLLAVGTI